MAKGRQQKVIGIVDLGSGNVGSLSNALSFCGYTPDICRDPGKINSYEKAILPGVGAFGAFADKIRSSGWMDELIIFCESKKPFLGICVGMQLLADTGEEFGKHKGLGWIKGQVVKLKSKILPHIGWNEIVIKKKNLIFNDLIEKDFYFVNSYVLL